MSTSCPLCGREMAHIQRTLWYCWECSVEVNARHRKHGGWNVYQLDQDGNRKLILSVTGEYNGGLFRDLIRQRVARM